ncbi:hypothetical protein SORBI_3004G134801 [Sorghum bicolor]|uniref:Uncharacterized protein n=1 Tax=Sorghum bicolor TaxID=4558 RepID=A0A1Z5RMA5_SORBI|nr:hypothetical protein SORBI_3004G134801 [Sorghum bicolor]
MPPLLPPLRRAKLELVDLPAHATFRLPAFCFGIAAARHVSPAPPRRQSTNAVPPIMLAAPLSLLIRLDDHRHRLLPASNFFTGVTAVVESSSSAACSTSSVAGALRSPLFSMPNSTTRTPLTDSRCTGNDSFVRVLGEPRRPGD